MPEKVAIMLLVRVGLIFLPGKLMHGGVCSQFGATVLQQWAQQTSGPKLTLRWDSSEPLCACSPGQSKQHSLYLVIQMMRH